MAEQGCEWIWILETTGFKINLGAANCGLAAAPWRVRSRSEAYLGGAASAGGPVGGTQLRELCSHGMKHNRSERNEQKWFWTNVCLPSCSAFGALAYPANTQRWNRSSSDIQASLESKLNLLSKAKLNMDQIWIQFLHLRVFPAVNNSRNILPSSFV